MEFAFMMEIDTIKVGIKQLLVLLLYTIILFLQFYHLEKDD